MEIIAKRYLRYVRDGLMMPICRVFFPFLPLKWLAYLAAMQYGVDYQHPRFYKVLLWMVGRNYWVAVEVLNNKLKRMPIEESRERAKLVWSSGSSAGWGRRAFEDPHGRCKHYVYTTIRDLSLKQSRPVSVLELGCMNGGSLHCLLFQGVEVSRYVGVDISKSLIREAQERFPDRDRFAFYEGDFIEFARTTLECFDVLLVKLTFMFLEQVYLETLLDLVGKKKIATRVVINERSRSFHRDGNSEYGNWGNTPVDYSHDYQMQFSRVGYVVETGGLIPHPTEHEAFLFRAVLVRSSSDERS